MRAEVIVEIKCMDCDLKVGEKLWETCDLFDGCSVMVLIMTYVYVFGSI